MQFKEIETKNCSNNFFFFFVLFRTDRIFARKIQLAQQSFGDGLNWNEFQKFLEKRRRGKKEKIPSLYCKYLLVAIRFRYLFIGIILQRASVLKYSDFAISNQSDALQFPVDRRPEYLADKSLNNRGCITWSSK